MDIDSSGPSCDFLRMFEAARESAGNDTSVWGMPVWLAWVLIAVLLIVSGLYSASENAFSNCNRFYFQDRANKGSKTAKLVTRLIEHFDNTLVTVLVGNNIVQTLMSFMSAILFLYICQALGVEAFAAVLSTVVMGALVYLVSDTLPKILSKSLPNRMAVFLAWPVFITEIILYPVIFIFRMVLALIHKLFHIEDKNIFSKDDLIYSVKSAVNDEALIDDEENEEAAEKLFEKNEEQIIENIFDFDKEKVASVYTPKKKVYSINISDLSISDLNKIIVDCPYSRILVYEDTIDNIVGVLVLKTYFMEYTKDSHLSIRSILEDVVDINIDCTINEAFKTLNHEKVHLGIVRKDDEYVGVISMQDILEELVEDIENVDKEKKV